MKFTTQHLSCEHGYVSIIQYDGDDIECGVFYTHGSDTCQWPYRIEEEPDWFSEEVCDIKEQISAYQERVEREMRDYESQVNADYLRGRGAK